MRRMTRHFDRCKLRAQDKLMSYVWLRFIRQERRQTGSCDCHERNLEVATPSPTSLHGKFRTINFFAVVRTILLHTPAFHRPRHLHARATNSNQNYHPHCCHREPGSTGPSHTSSSRCHCHHCPLPTSSSSHCKRHIIFHKLIATYSDLSVLVIQRTASCSS